MDENVPIAVLRLNEAEAFLVVEPLHGTRIHKISLSLTDGRGLAMLLRPSSGFRFLEKLLKRAPVRKTRRSGPVVRPRIDGGSYMRPLKSLQASKAKDVAEIIAASKNVIPFHHIATP
jgi:hypothetical protein